MREAYGGPRGSGKCAHAWHRCPRASRAERELCRARRRSLRRVARDRPSNRARPARPCRARARSAPGKPLPTLSASYGS